MLRWFLLWMGMVIAGGSFADPTFPERRIALVIGNAAYLAAALDSPVNDARAVAGALAATGFQVIKLENADQEQMLHGIERFDQAIRQGGVGVFYFAGHGVQIRGDNFLIPVNIKMEREEEIRAHAVAAQEVLDRMASAGNRLNLMFLDACRNDPFARGSRGGKRGLAAMDAALGTLISFATAPGQFAEDGEGANSAYSKHLAAAIKIEGLRLEDVLKRVRAGVRLATEGRQITWDSSSIEGDFFFVPPGGLPQTAAKTVDVVPPSDAVAAAQVRSGAARNMPSDAESRLLQQQFDEQFQPTLLTDMKPGMRFGVHPKARDEWRVFTRLPSGEPVPFTELVGKFLEFEKYETVDEATVNPRTRFIFSADGVRYEHSTLGKPEDLRRWRYDYTRIWGIYSVEQLKRARDFLEGKTLYVLTHQWWQQGANGEIAPQRAGRRYVPVRVQKVDIGQHLTRAVRVHFEDGDGNRGFLDVIAEVIPPNLDQGRGDYFPARFSFDNPRAQYTGVDREHWAKIEKGEIALGMTPREVQLAWDTPLAKSSTAKLGSETEQWEYSRERSLVFKNGALVEILRGRP